MTRLHKGLFSSHMRQVASLAKRISLFTERLFDQYINPHIRAHLRGALPTNTNTQAYTLLDLNNSRLLTLPLTKLAPCRTNHYKRAYTY
jgi:hypothetical protein